MIPGGIISEKYGTTKNLVSNTTTSPQNDGKNNNDLSELTIK